MTGCLEGRIALVTGGSSGIGRTSARALAREGAKVVIAARRIPQGEETVAMIQAEEGEAIFIQADVSRVAEVEALMAEVIKTYGRLDCAFNNAGIAGAGVPVHEYPEEAWDRLMRINLKGVWLCMKYEIIQMLAQGKGTIVNNASVRGLIGAPNASAYVASKHAVVGLTKTAALEYAQGGIRVNAVCPGWIRTPLIQERLEDPERRAQILATEPVGRVGDPEEVAAAVVWLCSDAASFVTGHAMAVDGGLVAQ